MNRFNHYGILHVTKNHVQISCTRAAHRASLPGMTSACIAKLFQPIPATLIALLVSVGALGAALVAQFGFDLKPCILCLWQRAPYALIILEALGMLVVLKKMPGANKWAPFFLSALAFLFLVSAGIAFFHVGVEQHWWSLEGGCPVGGREEKSADQMLAELLTTPVVPCDQISWRLFGLSITIWNVALSLGMAAYMALATFISATRKEA